MPQIVEVVLSKEVTVRRAQYENDRHFASAKVQLFPGDDVDAALALARDTVERGLQAQLAETPAAAASLPAAPASPKDAFLAASAAASTTPAPLRVVRVTGQTVPVKDHLKRIGLKWTGAAWEGRLRDDEIEKVRALEGLHIEVLNGGA